MKKHNFSLIPKNLELAESILKKYPKDKKRSAVLPILDLIQRQNGGWLSKESMEYASDFLSMPIIKIYEIATFYTMFNLDKIGKFHVQVCTNLPCMLRGANEIFTWCNKNLTPEHRKLVTVSEVECLGACVNAPIVQINDTYHENMSLKKIQNIAKELIK